MKIYKNSFFNLSVSFTEDWYLRSWSNWKKEPEDKGLMQRSDDDIPCVEGEQKLLFSAIRTVKSPRLISSQFSLAVYWNENKFDLNTKVVNVKNEISRKFKTGNLFGKKTQVRRIEYSSNSSVSTHEVIVWKASPNLWLSACMTGDNSENFEEALLQFNRLELKNEH